MKYVLPIQFDVTKPITTKKGPSCTINYIKAYRQWWIALHRTLTLFLEPTSKLLLLRKGSQKIGAFSRQTFRNSVVKFWRDVVVTATGTSSIVRATIIWSLFPRCFDTWSRIIYRPKEFLYIGHLWRLLCNYMNLLQWFEVYTLCRWSTKTRQWQKLFLHLPPVFPDMDK